MVKPTGLPRVFTIVIVFVAGCQPTMEQQTPSIIPPQPEESVSTLKVAPSAESVLLPAATAIPDGASLFFEVARDGYRLSERIDVTGRAMYEQELLHVRPTDGTPIRVLLRTPLDLKESLHDAQVTLSYWPTVTGGSLQERLSIAVEEQLAVELANLHDHQRIETDLAEGRISLRQGDPIGPLEVLPQVTRSNLGVEVSAADSTWWLAPGEQIELVASDTAFRLWVVGSMSAEPNKGMEGVFEGLPYHLTVLVGPGALWKD